MRWREIFSTTDRWSFKPAYICLLFVFLYVLVCQLPGIVGFFLIPLSFFSAPLAVLVLVALSASSLFQKQPRRAASALLALLLPAMFWHPIVRGAEIAHLGLTVKFGIGQIGSPTRSSDGKFAAYDWSVGLAINPALFLIQDETDRIALPKAQQPSAPEPENGFRQECAAQSEHLIGHYYICSF